MQCTTFPQFDKLPSEVQEKVLQKLDNKTLGRCLSVSKTHGAMARSILDKRNTNGLNLPAYHLALNQAATYRSLNQRSKLWGRAAKLIWYAIIIFGSVLTFVDRVLTSRHEKPLCRTFIPSLQCSPPAVHVGIVFLALLWGMYGLSQKLSLRAEEKSENLRAQMKQGSVSVFTNEQGKDDVRLDR